MAKTMDKVFLGILAILLVGLGGVFISAVGSTNDIQQKSSSQNKILLNEITPSEASAIALEAIGGTVQEIEVENEHGMSVYEVKVNDGKFTKDVKIDFSGKILGIELDDDGADVPIRGTPLEMASQAALDHIGEGRVTDSEIGDEEGFYEIEIRLDNGDEVDVHLDEEFNVLSTEYD